jgi:hypothetical protein
MTQLPQLSSPHHSTSPTFVSSIDAAPEIPGDTDKPIPHLDIGANISRSTTPVVADGRAPSSSIETNVVPLEDNTKLVYEPQDDLIYIRGIFCVAGYAMSVQK